MQSRCPWGFPAPVRCDLVQLLHKCVWESAVLKGRWKVSTSLSSFTWIQEAIWNMVKHHESKYHWEAPCSTHHGYFLRLHGGRKHYASSRLPSCTLLKLRAFEARESPRRPKVNLGFLFRLVYRCIRFVRPLAIGVFQQVKEVVAWNIRRLRPEWQMHRCSQDIPAMRLLPDVIRISSLDQKFKCVSLARKQDNMNSLL